MISRQKILIPKQEVLPADFRIQEEKRDSVRQWNLELVIHYYTIRRTLSIISHLCNCVA